VTSSIVFMKQLGLGMALAVALDATIVRALLVPAAMRLMGRWNWWSPRPLTRLWRRVGLGDLEGHGTAPLPLAPLAVLSHEGRGLIPVDESTHAASSSRHQA
jgi:RND superfamily putative drug exporter